MVKRIGLSLLVLSLLVAPAYAYAPSSWTTQPSESEKGLAKFKFGLKNLFFGWTEVFQEPYEAYKNKGNVFKATGVGLFNGVADTILGALHFVTSPVPAIDFPLPEGGVDL